MDQINLNHWSFFINSWDFENFGPFSDFQNFDLILCILGTEIQREEEKEWEKKNPKKKVLIKYGLVSELERAW